MDLGFWLSIVLGVGVAGHAVVGYVLATPLAAPTRPLWSRFGSHGPLLRLNGLLLVLASTAHLGVSWWKAADGSTAVFITSVLPFPPFAAAGVLERIQRTGWWHHGLMVAGWLAFAAHGAAVRLS